MQSRPYGVRVSLALIMMSVPHTSLFTAKAREVHISTASWGQTHHKGVEIPEGGDGSGLGEETGFQTKRKLAYLPTYGMLSPLWLFMARLPL